VLQNWEIFSLETCREIREIDREGFPFEEKVKSMEKLMENDEIGEMH